MTYPSGSGTMTNNYGPCFAPAATEGQAPPFPAPGAPPAAPGTAAVQDPAVYNFNNTITSTQELLNGTNENVTQQGSPALTNVSAVNLAGNAIGTLSFVQFTGAYQAK
jgi:hypothetical protein